jgi:hypothetical protein
MQITFTCSEHMRNALKASATHFLASCGVAILCAVLVFKLWYPWPLYELVAGRELFWLVVAVDVVCGPLLTLVVWNRSKPRSELLLDVSLIALLQLGALGYGLQAVAAARPVHIVFETDRLRVVTAAEIDPTDLRHAPSGLRSLPWSGPTLLSVRPPRDAKEFVSSVELSMLGKEPSMRPDWWQAYEDGIPQLLSRAKPLEDLFKAHPAQKAVVDTAVQDSGLSTSELLWLPLTSARSTEWVALIERRTGLPRGFAPVDGFL